MDKYLEILRKYGPFMDQQEYSVGNAIVVIKMGDTYYSTKPGTNFSQIQAQDVEVGVFDFIPGGEENKAMVLSQSPSCMKLLERGKNFKPSLDDMAQIIGPVLKIYDHIPSKMGSNAGCFLSDYCGKPYTLTIGRSLYEAIVAMTVVEKSASVSLLAEKIGGEKPIGSLETHLMRFVYKKKYSKAEEKVKTSEQGGSPEKVSSEEVMDYPAEELQLREKLVDYGKKLVATGLVQGTWGNLSARLDNQFMLVTPSGLYYERLTPAHMVKVNIETLEYDGSLKPTSEKGLHAEIYKRRPDAFGVIHTHSKFASVFAAAEKDVSDQVKLAAYGLAGTKALKNHTADALGQNYGCVMSHHGMVVCGTSLEDAFENCKRLEKECEDKLK